jgi:glutamate carboxypeptidase
MATTASLLPFLKSQMPATLEMLRQMVGINSFTGNRDGVNRLGRFTAEGFAPLGFEPEFVPSSNPAWGDHLVLTRRGRSSRSIAMISHLDTVFPPEEEARNQFHWQPDGDRIFGPGTHDIKGGTAMMWLVLMGLKEHAPKVFEEITWKLIWNSSEECFSPDFGEVCCKRFDSGTLAALVFEAEGRPPEPRGRSISGRADEEVKAKESLASSSSAGTEEEEKKEDEEDRLYRRHPGVLMVVARKGRATWRVTANGRGAHAGAYAVVQLGQTVQRIAALTDYSRQLTFNVGTICGGTVLNRVPHEAVAEGEFRAFTPEVYAQGKAGLLALAGPGEVKSPADGFACEVTVEIVTESSPWPRNPATERLCQLWKRAGEDLGISVEGEERGGLSDGNQIWDVVPTLDGLGPWGDNDHCSERSPDGAKLPEFVEISTFVPKAALNTLAILAVAES